MDFSLTVGLYLLGAISGALVILAWASDRGIPDVPTLPPENVETRARRSF